MRSVNVKKDALLEILEKNRSTHRKIFEEALVGYKKEAIQILEEHIKQIKSGKPKRVYVSIPYVEDHTTDYDAAIGMLKMSIDDEVQLDEQSYKNFVLDDWQWKRQFLATNSTYSSIAASMIDDED